MIVRIVVPKDVHVLKLHNDDYVRLYRNKELSSPCDGEINLDYLRRPDVITRETQKREL